jgi:hypothetical protein
VVPSLASRSRFTIYDSDNEIVALLKDSHEHSRLVPLLLDGSGLHPPAIFAQGSVRYTIPVMTMRDQWLCIRNSDHASETRVVLHEHRVLLI